MLMFDMTYSRCFDLKSGLFYICFGISFVPETYEAGTTSSRSFEPRVPNTLLAGHQRHCRSSGFGGQTRGAEERCGVRCTPVFQASSMDCIPITDPWDDCIFTYLWLDFYAFHVGKYASPISP